MPSGPPTFVWNASPRRKAPRSRVFFASTSGCRQRLVSRIRSANGRFALQTVESREIIARSATFNPLMAGFLLDSLNQAIDLESARRTAFQNHVPESVIHVKWLRRPASSHAGRTSIWRECTAIRLIRSSPRAASSDNWFRLEPIRIFRLVPIQRLREAYQVFWVHANDAATRGVDVRYQQGCDRQHKR
jgi:hypothetical protein